MIICKKCRAEVPDDTYFCEKCGELMHGQNETATPAVQLGSNVEQQKQSPTPESVVFTPPEAPATTNYTTVLAHPAVGVSRQKLDEFFVGMVRHDSMEGWGQLLIYGDRIEFKPNWFARRLSSLKENIVMPLGEITAINEILTPLDSSTPWEIQIVLRSGKEYLLALEPEKKNHLKHFLNYQSEQGAPLDIFLGWMNCDSESDFGHVVIYGDRIEWVSFEGERSCSNGYIVMPLGEIAAINKIRADEDNWEIQIVLRSGKEYALTLDTEDRSTEDKNRLEHVLNYKYELGASK